MADADPKFYSRVTPAPWYTTPEAARALIALRGHTLALETHTATYAQTRDEWTGFDAETLATIQPHYDAAFEAYDQDGMRDYEARGLHRNAAFVIAAVTGTHLPGVIWNSDAPDLAAIRKAVDQAVLRELVA